MSMMSSSATRLAINSGSRRIKRVFDSSSDLQKLIRWSRLKFHSGTLRGPNDLFLFCWNQIGLGSQQTRSRPLSWGGWDGPWEGVGEFFSSRAGDISLVPVRRHRMRAEAYCGPIGSQVVVHSMSVGHGAEV